MTLAVMQMRLS